MRAQPSSRRAGVACTNPIELSFAKSTSLSDYQNMPRIFDLLYTVQSLRRR